MIYFIVYTSQCIPTGRYFNTYKVLTYNQRLVFGTTTYGALCNQGNYLLYVTTNSSGVGILYGAGNTFRRITQIK